MHYYQAGLLGFRQYLISRITLCNDTTLFLQWLQTISYIVFSNISDIWQIKKTSFTIKSGLFVSLQVIWSQSPWFEYCSYARFIHLVSLFSVSVTGKSISEALILESVNPQLLIEFPEKYKFRKCCVQILFWMSKQKQKTNVWTCIFRGIRWTKSFHILG